MQPINRKPLLDTVRRMLKRGIRQFEVDRLDRAIDASLEFSEDRVPGVPSCGVSEAGLPLVKTFQGCARLRLDGMVEPHPDPGTGGDRWTIGWRATVADVTPRTFWTPAHCDTRLEADLARHAADVCVTIGNATTTQSQFNVLVSFH